jgi:hypothetical protein
VNIAGAAHVGDSMARDGIVHNRPAFLGGLGGTSVAMVLAGFLAAGVAAGGEVERSDEDDAFELDLIPGSIARLGKPLDPTRKNVTADRRAPDPVPDDPSSAAVSRDANDVSPAKPTEPKAPTPPKPRDDRDPRIPVGPKPTHANTPHDDLPTIDHDVGIDLGKDDGWSDLMRAGDAWATSVMATLARMEVGSFAGDIGPGDFRFQLTICKDGTIERVQDKGGSLADEDQAKVALALETLLLPKPTEEIRALMDRDCVKLKHVFSWSRTGVK